MSDIDPNTGEAEPFDDEAYDEYCNRQEKHKMSDTLDNINICSSVSL